MCVTLRAALTPTAGAVSPAPARGSGGQGVRASWQTVTYIAAGGQGHHFAFIDADKTGYDQCYEWPYVYEGTAIGSAQEDKVRRR